MHTVYIHIDEELGGQEMRSLQGDLAQVRYINDVEVNERIPHDLLVEFDETHISPMAILRELNRHGLHADIMSC
ncbi:MAG: hypothetical protein PVI91_05235 [Gammaproteobacteria bacterium]